MNAQNLVKFVIPLININNLKIWKIVCFVTNVRKRQKGPDALHKEYVEKAVN